MSRSMNAEGFGGTRDISSSSSPLHFKKTSQSLPFPPRSTEGIDEFFDPPLENKYECPVCLLGLREPVQTQCGHRFCRNCIVRSLRDAGNKCPVDNEPLSESGLYPDNFAKREMGEFTVWCRHHKNRGCPWKGTLNNLEDHMRSCEFSDCACPNACGKIMELRYMEEHMNVCPKRRVQCEYCKAFVLYTEIKAHYKDCPKYEVACSKCKEKVTNEKLAHHREKLCPKERIKCPLEFLGCKEENFIPEINKHLQANFASHILDLAATVKTLQIKQESLAAACSQGARAKQQPSTSYGGCSAEDNSAQLLLPDFKTIRDRVARLEDKYEDLAGRVCSGTYIWKIENYELSRQQAINQTVPAIHSPQFYTSLYGYKMCLRMNLNGVDSGIDRHLSLFVHMMRGEWDDILEWPFTGRITLAILDQSDNADYRRPISETLVAKPNLLAFQKPTAHRNHKGYGYVEFCQLDQLVVGQYIKNDSMLVRIQVFH